MDWKLKDKSEARKAVMPLVEERIKQENIKLKRYVLNLTKQLASQLQEKNGSK